jgi:hypothetical protein
MEAGMRDDVLPDTPPTEEERLAARRLAEALESNPRALQEWETSRVVHLMEAARGEDPDELSTRRLRRELVASSGISSRRRRWRPLAAAVAAAAAIGLLAVYAGRLIGRPGERLLEEREQAARAALSSVAATGGTGLAGAYERRWAYRSDSNLESARYQRLTGTTTAASAGAALVPSSTGGHS